MNLKNVWKKNALRNIKLETANHLMIQLKFAYYTHDTVDIQMCRCNPCKKNETQHNRAVHVGPTHSFPSDNAKKKTKSLRLYMYFTPSDNEKIRFVYSRKKSCLSRASLWILLPQCHVRS